ncbi:Acetyltransferase-like protein 1 [Elsinoe fawcettii]|nr:Acetyltransferase-like protein 1 [Elsinoe fawcettii]
MSVSIRSSPQSSFDHFASRPMEQNTSKFIAVNGAGHRDHQQQSFTSFRPDSSAAMVNGHASQSPGASEIARETPNFGYARNPSEKQALQADSQGLFDNINVGKRKRSPEVDEPMKRPDSHHSPTTLPDAPIVAASLTQTPSTTSPIWTDSPQTQGQPRSPDESQIAETLKRDIARYDTAPDQHTSTSPQENGDTQDHAIAQGQDDMQPFPKKRAFTNRTKTGCHTCRRRKKKCDEGKPQCLNCLKGSFHCEGYGEKKVVGPPTQSNSRGRASTGNLASRSYQPQSNYQTFAAGFPDYRGPPPGSEPGRRSTELFNGNSRETWGVSKQAWPSEMPNPSQQLQASNPHGAPGRSAPIFDLDRDEATAQERLITAARLGTAIAPAGGPPNNARPTLITSLSSNGNNGQSSSDRTRERNRMLVGQPFLHYCDLQLVEDRRECRAALERYNNSTRPSVGTSEEECGRLFKSIIMPELRPASNADGRPSGSIGHYVMVEAPFTCEYGYNIHLGDEVVIGANCTMQDAAKIKIGNRSVIGPNVRFYTMTLPTDRRARGGAKSLAIAAPITIEEDCFIGADVLILPGRRVGRGCTIGAGTVVSKDVPENCVVAGNPPKVLRFSMSVQDDPQGHKPERYRDEEIATLMMKQRGFTLTGK